MKTKLVTSPASASLALFATMSRDELRKLAKAVGVPTGHNRYDTERNLAHAVGDVKVHFKAHCTISTNPAKQGEPTQRKTFLGKTLRTYVSGPGKANETWITPDAPVDGSPSPR